MLSQRHRHVAATWLPRQSVDWDCSTSHDINIEMCTFDCYLYYAPVFIVLQVQRDVFLENITKSHVAVIHTRCWIFSN